MNLDLGLIPIRLLCEESPAMLQVVCSIPVKVPKEKITSTGLVLHRLKPIMVPVVLFSCARPDRFRV